VVYVGFIIQQKGVSVKRKRKKSPNKGCDKCGRCAAAQQKKEKIALGS
jgi:uncharacterized cysteine cluster protein YcgN (CxxCxxCC family)